MSGHSHRRSFTRSRLLVAGLIAIAAVAIAVIAAARLAAQPPAAPAVAMAGASGPTSPAANGVPDEFSGEFSPSSPLRMPLSSQVHTTFAAGSSTEVDAWNNEVAGGPGANGPFGPSRPVLAGGIPVYVSSKASDPIVTVTRCTKFGGNCKLAGTRIHVNPNVLIQGWSDQHLIIIDPLLKVEVDCWQALARSGRQDQGSGDLRPDLSQNKLTCSWGGAYELGSTGLRGSYPNESPADLGDGIHFGPAAGLYFVTPHELLRGHIDHAIALNANCANDPMIYPANDTSKSDATCYSGGSGPPHYGDAFQLNWSPAKIAASAHSKECKAVLTAMATYGAFISDTGAYGTVWDFEGTDPYTVDPDEMGPNPWPTILGDLQAAGDADGSGNWNFCFNGLGPADFNLVELTPPHR